MVACEHGHILGCRLNQNFWLPKMKFLPHWRPYRSQLRAFLTIYITKFYGWTIGVGEMFRHNVRSKCEIGRTYSKFGRTMSDDRLLFPALTQMNSKNNAYMYIRRPAES